MASICNLIGKMGKNSIFIKGCETLLPAMNILDYTTRYLFFSKGVLLNNIRIS